MIESAGRERAESIVQWFPCHLQRAFNRALLRTNCQFLQMCTVLIQGALQEKPKHMEIRNGSSSPML